MNFTIWGMWQNECNNNMTQLQTVNPNVRSAQEGGQQLTRRERVVLTKLRIGHTHSHVLQKDHLHFGGTALLTVAQIIQDCQQLNHQRQAFNIPSYTRNTLQWKINVIRLFKFLKTIDVYDLL